VLVKAQPRSNARRASTTHPDLVGYMKALTLSAIAAMLPPGTRVTLTLDAPWRPEFIRTAIQERIALHIACDLFSASAPACMADELFLPVGTVKTYLRRLRLRGVLLHTGRDPFTGGFSHAPGPRWPDFIDEALRITP